MDLKFEELPEEKKQRIINAALEVFAKYEYKRASTDLIASKAQISKGLLFYYFQNKKSLYMYLVEYMMGVVSQAVLGDSFWQITDFFELLECAIRRKVQIMGKNPYIMEFSVRVFYEKHRDVEDAAAKYSQSRIGSMYQDYFTNIDRSRFKEEVDPDQVLHMIIWLADGYMHQQMSLGLPISLKSMMEQYQQWAALLKKAAYRKEFQA